MSTMDLTAKIETIKSLQLMIEELTAEMETAKDEIKGYMAEQNADEISVSCYKVRWKEVKTNRFDSTSFKKTHEELYSQYLKETVSKRFTIA